MENIVSKILGKKHQWIIILLVGILLIVVAMPTKKETDSKIIAGHNIGDETSTEIEIRLKKLLENITEVISTNKTTLIIFFILTSKQFYFNICINL